MKSLGTIERICWWVEENKKSLKDGDYVYTNEMKGVYYVGIFWIVKLLEWRNNPWPRWKLRRVV